MGCAKNKLAAVRAAEKQAADLKKATKPQNGGKVKPKKVPVPETGIGEKKAHRHRHRMDSHRG